jgi:hypothetical protein
MKPKLTYFSFGASAANKNLKTANIDRITNTKTIKSFEY